MLTGSRAVVFVAGAGLVAVWFAAAADRQPNIAASETQRRERDGLVRAERLADQVHGEWFWRILPDGNPDPRLPKVSEWKGPYHGTRACLETLHRLDILASRHAL